MLSDEEKKAVEKLDYIQDFIIENGQYNADVNDMEYFSKVLNLIEKQSKEIEHQIEKRANQRNELAILNAKQVEFNKLVNTVNSYKGQFKRQEKEIEELKKPKYLLNAKTGEITTINNSEFISKDKIKAKIEEIENEDKKYKNYLKDGRENFTPEYVWARPVLQSLLEKE